MCVGVPKETAAKEQRVALTPQGAAALAKAGFNINVENNAGSAAQFAVRMLSTISGRAVTKVKI